MRTKLKWFPHDRLGWASLLMILAGSTPAASAELSGWLNAQTRYYPQTGEQVEERTYPAGALQLDFSQSWSDADQLTASLFLRGDAQDDSRNQGDIRELLWQHSADAWQLRAGVGQASWGVMEMFKITDVINQEDRAELPLPRKLGQPMASVSFYLGEDLIELYSLYGVRPAWFPGEDGRLRYPLPVDWENPEYDWGATHRWDFAGRWKTRIGGVELALSHFYGMSRDPYFIFNYDFDGPSLIPVYEKVNQTGIEWQYACNDILFKAETLYQTGAIEQYESAAAGFEYTFGGLFGSGLDLTWLVEGIWDSRDQVDATLFDHDVGIGARIAFNDARDSNLLLGIIADTRYSEQIGSLFWTNTFGEHWTFNFTGQYFHANDDRYNPADYLPYLEQIVQENPVTETSIDYLLGLLDDVTISKAQYDRVLAFTELLRADPDYWATQDVATIPQTLFDLLRVSDNSQKMNLIERDSYVQVDVYYHF